MLLAAVGLGWLSIGDRVSPVALMVVEWETRIGIFFYQPLALVGLVSLGISIIPAREAAPRRRPSERAPQATHSTYPEGVRWAPQVFQNARQLTWEIGASLELDRMPGTPFELKLSQMPPASEQRSLEQLARFIASIPTPHRVSVRFMGSQATNNAHHRVRAAVRQVFSPSDFQVLRQDQEVLIVFHTPDPRWDSRR
jgi:hypothetical protein